MKWICPDTTQGSVQTAQRQVNTEQNQVLTPVLHRALGNAWMMRERNELNQLQSYHSLLEAGQAMVVSADGIAVG